MTQSASPRSALSRRQFLGAGLAVTFLSGCSLPVFPKRPNPEPDTALAWIRHDQGHWYLHLPRIEMGQNISTALKQIACDELDISWQDLTVLAQDTGSIGPVKSTVGSESVRDFALPLAQACATLKQALDNGQRHGHITAKDWPAPKLRSFRGKGRFVGKAPSLVDGADMVTGLPLYTADMRRDGMVYGRVLHAPIASDLESHPLSWNDDAAKAVPGFVAIIDDDLLKHGQSRGVGIVAKTPGALDRMEAALAVKWSAPPAPPTSLVRVMDIDRRMTDGGLDNVLVDDGPGQAAAWDVDLRLDVPPAAHASIEPRACLAYESDDGWHIWTGSQDIFYVRDVLVNQMGMDKDRITVHACRVGGGFGGKTLCFQELEAAILSRAVKHPVKLQWTREQEFARAFHRPPSSHRIRARLDQGRVTDWHHAFSSGHVIFTNAGLPPWLQKMTDLVGDKGVARGAIPPYAIARKRIEYDLERLPILTGPWRGLGAGPNTLAIEMAMDECAIAANRDPLQFRLDHAEDPRLRAVLKTVSNLANPVADDGSTRGLACGIYKNMSYAAVIADIVPTGDRRWRVTKFWCAHDCGQVINPDQVRAQCEGNLIWGLGMMATEGLVFAGHNVSAEQFADSPIPTMANIPEMEIALVNHGDTPTGAGETAIVASAAAIANALRRLTGNTVNQLPVQGFDG